MKALAWAVEQWPGNASIIIVRGHGICESRLTNGTLYREINGVLVLTINVLRFEGVWLYVANVLPPW